MRHRVLRPYLIGLSDPSLEEILIGATSVINQHMPVILVCVHKSIVEDLVIYVGLGVNIITEGEQRRLGLSKLSLVPFNLKMVDSSVSK